MTDISQILNTLNASPSVELLRLRNREMIIEFLVNTFNQKAVISSENIHIQLADFLGYKQIENDDRFLFFILFVVVSRDHRRDKHNDFLFSF